MTTIVLISIGVLLAAASAMMALHFGGDAFNSGSVKARAATLENAGQNVRVALTGRAFTGQRKTPTSLDELHGPASRSGWMSELPDVSQAGGGTAVIMDFAGKRIYGVPGIPDDVCMQINRNRDGTRAIVPNGLEGNQQGCMSRPDGSNLYFVVLGDS